jgi:hypothetical protein
VRRRLACLTTALTLLGASAVEAKERVSAAPRPVHFGETLTVMGGGWPVIEFCSRNVRISLTTSQQGFRIGTAHVRASGRFTFRWVPRRSRVGAGLWRLRARMRCESGKDGSTIYRRASVRLRIVN